jgi:tetratricopeptide (TPR) repeat protein
MNRLQQLEEFYRDDPNDPFNIYGLALEHLKGDKSKSRQLFEELLRTHPSYIPAYYHAAKLFADLDERTLAIQTYEKGIAQAKELKDYKALRELQSAYDEFVFE